MDLNEAKEILEWHKKHPVDLTMLPRSDLLRYIEALEILPLRAVNKMFSDWGFAYVSEPQDREPIESDVEDEPWRENSGRTWE